MKTLKITPPEGYEIDKDKSTLEEIIFKPVKKQLPQSWEELETIEGYWSTSHCGIIKNYNVKCRDENKNLFATEAQAKASIALAQLSQLREVYRDGWVPDWNSYRQKQKYSIININEIFIVNSSVNQHYFLTFQSAEIRDEFLNNFKDLIEEASPLLFG